jgi:hypothetical protein
LFNLGSGNYSLKSKKRQSKTGYQASFDAWVFGIFTKKKPTKSIYSGQETRAIYDPTGVLSKQYKSMFNTGF